MSSLTDKKLKDTYKGVLKTTGDNSELDSNYKRVTDGNGNDSGVELKGTSSGDVRFGGKVQAQGNIEKVDGGGSVTGTYKTETENDARYLQSVPAEFVTETEGDARYLQSVPAEFLTQTEGDARYTLSGGAGEVNDLSSTVTWANVPDANITQSSVTQHQGSLALASNQITSGTLSDSRIAQSNVTQHQSALSITESQISDLQANPTDFVSKASGGTFGGAVQVPHSTYHPTGNFNVLHRGQFIQTFHHHINNGEFSLTNNWYTIPWAEDNIASEGSGGYSSSDNPIPKYRFLCPFTGMRLLKFIAIPTNNTFNSYTGNPTISVNMNYKQESDSTTHNPNITSNGTFTMSAGTTAPSGIGQQPALVYSNDIDNGTEMGTLQGFTTGMEILMLFKSDTALTNNYGWVFTSVWACSL